MLRALQVKAVATAAEGALKAFIGLLNPQGIKIILPDLLAALDTKKVWQTKTAALASLGQLTARAPDQVSVCLPDIIPAITAIMGDAKPQVKVRGASFLLSAACTLPMSGLAVEILGVVSAEDGACPCPEGCGCALLGKVETCSHPGMSAAVRFVHRRSQPRLGLSFSLAFGNGSSLSPLYSFVQARAPDIPSTVLRGRRRQAPSACARCARWWATATSSPSSPCSSRASRAPPRCPTACTSWARPPSCRWVVPMLSPISRSAVLLHPWCPVWDTSLKLF